MNSVEHDDLWQLLGKLPPTQGSPFFSRNVLRLVREERNAPSLWCRLPPRRWAVSVVTACALLLTTFVFLKQSEEPDPVGLLASQVTASPDYQVIGHLDELLDSELNSVWLEASAY